MSTFNKHHGDRERFGKCQICLEYIPIEYYFGIGDTIMCYGCGSEYVIESKNPVKLNLSEGVFDPDGLDDEFLFNTGWDK
ncbi:hypothetical protein [Desulfopila inferna]|uniref:hypothetical protein n=1 Tax=Desulfopila inferna TaxID=468528 RepID=UPI00196637D7|nr:hypothetical protein [Desulfopila inferna]MBM9606022.1 hypothetical protein [Desulfopila inferna]